ncbi:MAG: UMP kinase [Patescibacteria group bacterium]|jgi:uridylate kinase
MFKRTIVISLGGSLVVPDHINARFLKSFRSMVLSYVKKKFRFILIVGGGKTARRYQAAASDVTQVSPEDLDWLGIHSTRLNGHLMRTIFRGFAYPKIITSHKKINTHVTYPVIVGAGFTPGSSTDLRAVQLAKAYDADTILNLSNIDYVYTKDPAKHADAKKITAIAWDQFQKIVGTRWNPGANVPFDPVASKLAKRFRMKVCIVNGKKLDNIQRILQGRSFRGTIIV